LEIKVIVKTFIRSSSRWWAHHQAPCIL